MENTIAVVSDRIFLEHRAPEGDHPERPERIRAATTALESARLPGRRLDLTPRDATIEELCRVHAPAYVEELSGIAGRSGYLDEDTYFVPASHGAALRAAGGCVALVDALMKGEAQYGVGLVRPPGHHARPAAAMGFCLLNNVAVAAAHARARGAERVAIVDWDVHHGNGTQEIFYEDPAVLFVSLHQFPFYPGTGSVAEVGRGDGVGATLNVPLSAGAADAAYLAAFDRIVAPRLFEFDPDLVLVSAGFDAHVRDPLGEMRVTNAGYAGMLRRISRALPRGARGRLGIVLEGGYDLEGLGGGLRATLEAVDSTENEADPGLVAPAHLADLDRAEGAARKVARFG
jgi:acetoin utilization deacetylase AcuC-like enzyme